MREIYELGLELAVMTIMTSLFSFSPIWAHRLVFCRIHTLQKPTSGSTRSRFTLADFACLFVYVAFINGLIRLVNSGIGSRATFSEIQLVVAGNLLAFFAWLIAIRYVTDRGLREGSQKSLFLLVFYPASIVVSVHCLLSCLTIMMTISGLGRPNSFGMPDASTLIAIGGFPYVIMAVWVLRNAFANYLFNDLLEQADRSVDPLEE